MFSKVEDDEQIAVVFVENQASSVELRLRMLLEMQEKSASHRVDK